MTRIPVAGALIAASLPLIWHAHIVRRERAALDLVQRIQQVQEQFRAGGGRGGYATGVESLITPCPGERAAPAESRLESGGYEVTVRPAEAARATGVDCHGRPTTSAYYVSAAPRTAGVDGRRAYAAVAGSDVFVFFDGLAPAEIDMQTGGMATPASILGSFKIP